MDFIVYLKVCIIGVVLRIIPAAVYARVVAASDVAGLGITDDDYLGRLYWSKVLAVTIRRSSMIYKLKNQINVDFSE
jgi:hypothetical protein